MRHNLGARVGAFAVASVALLVGPLTALASATPDPSPDPSPIAAAVQAPTTGGGKATYPTVEGAATRRAQAPQLAGLPLTYKGGNHGIGVTTGAPKVYLVFWGSQWGAATPAGSQNFANDALGVAPRLVALMKGIGTNNELWSTVNSQYCEGVPVGTQTCAPGDAHVGYPTGGAYAGVWNDTTSAAPTTATDNQIAVEAVNAAAHFGNTTPASNRSAQYVIVSATGMHPGGFNTASANWCAWHDWNGDTSMAGGAANSPYGDIAFTNLPYIPDMGASCGQNYVNAGAAGLLDGVTIVEGHEYAETITDQNPAGGWTDSAGAENADKCAWVGVGGDAGASNVAFSNGSFAMQSTWSNHVAGCQIAYGDPVIPANDNFASAINLPGTAASTTGTNNSATLEAGEPQHLTGNAGGASVWWKWTAPSNGTVTIDLSASGFDTTMAVYTGSAVGSLTKLASDDDSGTGSTSLVSALAVTGGTTYRIAVDGYSGATGNIGLALTSTTTASAPGAPTIGSAAAGDSVVLLNWTAPASNGGSAITGYVVTPYLGAVAQPAQTFNTTATSQTITGLTNGSTYTFKVAAKNAIGTGAQSGASNTATPAARVLKPGVGSITEGNSGQVTVDVPITLSASSPVPVTVNFTTADTGATGVATAGTDYVAKSGTVTFTPGETAKSVSIQVKGDLVDELPLLYGEWIVVSFSASSGASIDPGFFGLGVGIIIDDDPTPVIAPGNGIVVEGNAGDVTVNVPVTLSNPSSQTITVNFATLDTGAVGIATAGTDYAAKSGTVTFLPGETAKTVSIVVHGDTLKETPTLYGEWIFVQFSGASPGATLSTAFAGRGVGIIQDDD